MHIVLGLAGTLDGNYVHFSFVLFSGWLRYMLTILRLVYTSNQHVEDARVISDLLPPCSAEV
jgi:hypothetical protein